MYAPAVVQYGPGRCLPEPVCPVVLAYKIMRALNDFLCVTEFTSGTLLQQLQSRLNVILALIFLGEALEEHSGPKGDSPCSHSNHSTQKLNSTGEKGLSVKSVGPSTNPRDISAPATLFLPKLAGILYVD